MAKEWIQLDTSDEIKRYLYAVTHDLDVGACVYIEITTGRNIKVMIWGKDIDNSHIAIEKVKAVLKEKSGLSKMWKEFYKKRSNGTGYDYWGIYRITQERLDTLKMLGVLYNKFKNIKIESVA